MKKLITLLFFSVLIFNANAQNTFPTPSGNAGIGTTTPSQKLDVIGRMKLRSDNSATAGTWLTGVDGVESLFVGQTNNSGTSPFGIYHSGNWRLVVNNNGYVGIELGNGLPTQQLDVIGRSKFRASGTNSSGLWLTGTDGTETAFIGQTDASSTSPVGIYHSSDWRLIVNSSGKVGIGTLAPNSYKLAVAGSIGAWGEVRVFTTGAAFPDYVFDPAYQLPSLEETEKYVKENRHLPEVPSAADIEKDGMSLNGMNTILLKKVEELTLHIIDQNKRIEALEKKLND